MCPLIPQLYLHNIFTDVFTYSSAKPWESAAKWNRHGWSLTELTVKWWREATEAIPPSSSNLHITEPCTGSTRECRVQIIRIMEVRVPTCGEEEDLSEKVTYITSYWMRRQRGGRGRNEVKSWGRKGAEGFGRTEGAGEREGCVTWWERTRGMAEASSS